MSTTVGPEFEPSESLSRTASGSKAAQSGDVQTSGAPPEVQTLVYGEFEKHVVDLRAFSTKVADFIELALKERVAGRWQQSDDDLFLPHTLLVKIILDKPAAIRAAFALLPAKVWTNDVWPRTKAAEEQIKKSDPKARIHKGAPFFNVALCFFVAGDFDKAFQYFTQAGIEDELSGRGSRYLVPTGDNPLAEKAIISPLVKALLTAWHQDYKDISSVTLNQGELKSLLAWLVQRAPDAFQTITALHRLRLLTQAPDNEASRYQTVRALADIALSIESSLRRWQTDLDGQFHARADALLAANPVSHAAFQTFHTDFGNAWTKPQRESGAAVNWVVSQTFSRLAAHPAVAQRVGIAAYLAVRLRNSLMHVNEETLDIHNNPKLCLRAAGVVFGVLRASKHGNENSLASL